MYTNIVQYIATLCVHCWIIKQLVVPDAEKLTVDETQQQNLQQTADDDINTPIKADQQSSVPHIKTASGLKYAVSNKASVKDSSDKMKKQEVCNNTAMYVCKVV